MIADLDRAALVEKMALAISQHPGDTLGKLFEQATAALAAHDAHMQERGMVVRSADGKRELHLPFTADTAQKEPQT